MNIDRSNGTYSTKLITNNLVPFFSYKICLLNMIKIITYMVIYFKVKPKNIFVRLVKLVEI